MGMNETRLIDATALLNYIASMQREDEDRVLTYDEVKKLIRDTPTKTYEVKTSSWGRHVPSSAHKVPDVFEYLEYVQCNYCRSWTMKLHSARNSDFCPNCGCRMLGDDNG